MVAGDCLLFLFGFFGVVLTICAVSALMALWRLVHAQESIAKSMKQVEDYARRMAGVPPTMVK